MITKLIDDYLIIWIILSIVLGITFPQIAILEMLSTPILAIMVGSISLTLSIEQLKSVNLQTVIKILITYIVMIVISFGLSVIFQLSVALMIGMIILSAVTPELVTPTLTKLAKGNVALSTVILIVIGLISIILLPIALKFVVNDTIQVDVFLFIRGLLLAVVIPMISAIILRNRFTTSIAKFDIYYPTISSLMVILIIGIVAAVNSSRILNPDKVLILVTLVIVLYNLIGYGVGWIASLGLKREDKISSVFSVGMRDFAVASTLVLSANLPAIATLPAFLFGLVEMLSSSGLVKYFQSTDKNSHYR